MIIGRPDPEVVQRLAQVLAEILNSREDVLLDVSADQSHFHEEAQARQIDSRGLKAIESMEVEKFWQGHVRGEMEVDAFHAVSAGMLAAAMTGATEARVLRYTTSADASGDRSRVVGYAAVGFFFPASEGVSGPLTAAQKRRLLQIARETADGFVRTGRVPDIKESDKRLQTREGAFVTLYREGRLRGCIGQIVGQTPLYLTVRDMAVAAAARDPRFAAVGADELGTISIEISVLSVPRRVGGPGEIEMGRHGVIVSRGPVERGVFLPQVATETGWSREEFLSELCSQKAGLPQGIAGRILA